ncbi:MAG TPA: histidine kinase [Solirubrobacteraceae bacterium]|jgi:signal transduction histidine kinase
MARALTHALSDRLRGALPPVVDEDPSASSARRRRVVDAAMYFVAFAISTVNLIDTWELHAPWLRPVAVLSVGATVGALRWRRSHPGAVGIFVAAISVVLAPTPFVAMFNAAIRARGRDLAVVAVLTLVTCFSNPLLYRGPQSLTLEFGAGLFLAGAAIGWGLFVRARRALVRSLHQQAERAGVEARAAERRRIAREMHDVLAHRLSLLSVHAGALEFHRDASPEEVAAAAAVIRESARAALEELRGVIGVLREDGGESLTDPPQPTLADIPALVAESRAAGMRITARIDLGDAAATTTAAAGRTAYRIVQEALTNARKHAPGAAVTLSVEAPDGDLRVEVRSLAPVAVAAGAPLPGAQTGLIGLAERVTLAGGELESGVDPEGAFVLRARLPR